MTMMEEMLCCYAMFTDGGMQITVSTRVTFAKLFDSGGSHNAQ